MPRLDPKRNMRNPVAIPPITLTEVMGRVAQLQAVLNRQADRSFKVALKYETAGDLEAAKVISAVAAVATTAALECDFIGRELKVLAERGEISAPLEQKQLEAMMQATPVQRKPKRTPRSAKTPLPAPWA